MIESLAPLEEILESSNYNISDGLTLEEEDSFARSILLSTDMLDITQVCFPLYCNKYFSFFKMAVLSGKEH